ncbi:MAG: GntR family transcriptional regulator [Rhodobacteraceae bacterium]|nr:GntR family transcriptional regulator [Paracoccaceae bacterium]
MAEHQENYPEEESPLYGLVLDDIARGVYGSGTRLRIHEIAKRHGTSINPVREVLRRMEGEGLVRFEKNRGATITELDRAAVEKVYELIILIEPHLIAGFAESCTPEQVHEVERIQERLKAVPLMDKPQFTATDMEFHLAIVTRHYNERAVRVWLTQRRLLNILTRRNGLTRTRHEEIIREHDELIAAFRAHDPVRATEVINRHIDGAGRALRFYLDME